MPPHQVAIAKASLAAALLRPDPLPVSKDGIAHLHRVLDSAVSHCSPSNVETCKEWLLEHVVTSSTRITALGKYVAALTASFEDDQPESRPATNQAARPASANRRRLHILYILTDLFHHTSYHEDHTTSHSSLTSGLQPSMPAIVSAVASCSASKFPKLHRKLDQILELWGKNAYYGQDYIHKLQGAATQARENKGVASVQADAGVTDKNTSQVRADVPYLMPTTHGDLSTPYHDLPAGNFLPHIIPNSTVPINPRLVKPIQFVAGPADESLVTIVKDFLADVRTIYNDHTDMPEDEGIVVDVDEMGQPVVKDELTGEMVVKETYYGWSVEFCERMKKRLKGTVEPGPDRRRPQSRSLSRSPSRSRSRSRSRNRAWGRGRGRSRSRSSTPRKRRRYSSSRSVDRSRSRSASRRMRPLHHQGMDRRREEPGSQYRHEPSGPKSQNLPPSSVSTSFTYSQGGSFPPPLATPVDQIDNPIPQLVPSAPVQLHHQSQFPVGSNGLPIPPPPPYHSGPWPPALPQSMPPIPPGASPPSFLSQHFPGIRGFVPPPPPPPVAAPGAGQATGWSAYAQPDHLASPMPLWSGSNGSSKGGAGTNGDSRSSQGPSTGTYEQTRDPRRSR